MYLAGKDKTPMLEQLQKDIPYQFRQVKLLSAALTHSSYANERQNSLEHNERLEFLGDAVLELCVSDALYRRFGATREGQLTAMRSKLVKQETLASLARSLGLPAVLALGKGEESQGGRERDSLLSDAFEALLGAIYLDGGFEAAQEVILRRFASLWPDQDEKVKAKDSKSRLQEVVQELFKGRPAYRLMESSGPEHAKIFEVRLELPDKRVFTASGSSVKRAEQIAARMALEALLQEPGTAAEI